VLFYCFVKRQNLKKGEKYMKSKESLDVFKRYYLKEFTFFDGTL